MENWAWSPDILGRVTRHPVTGEPMPAELADRLAASRNVDIGSEYLRSFGFYGDFDMRVHGTGSGRSRRGQGGRRRGPAAAEHPRLVLAGGVRPHRRGLRRRLLRLSLVARLRRRPVEPVRGRWGRLARSSVPPIGASCSNLARPATPRTWSPGSSGGRRRTRPSCAGPGSAHSPDRPAERGGRHAVRVHAQAGAHDRAHARADPPGRGGRLRLRLAVRQPRPVARPVPAPDADGRGDRAAAPRDLRHEPGDPRADASRPAPWPTLDEISGGRMDLGIGRGDSARRVLGKPPTTMANPRRPFAVIRDLVEGGTVDYEGTDAPLPVDRRLDAARLDRRLRPDGAGDDRPDRRRRHPPARRPGPHPLVRRARSARRRVAAGRDPARSGSRPRRPPTSATARARSRADALVPGPRQQPRRRPRQQVPARGAAGGADRLHPGPRGLRLPAPRRGRLVERGVRRRRGHRPVLRPRLGRRAHRQAARAGRGRRRPVQHLPDERRRGGRARDLRPGDRPVPGDVPAALGTRSRPADGGEPRCAR